MKLLFINGPNANLYGLDPSGTYGQETFPDIAARCHRKAATLGVELDFRQSQDEGEIITWIQQARGHAQGVIINAAGLSYTSIAIMDALLSFDGPVIEVHMSNIHRREPFRNKTYTAKAAVGSICGLGPHGYELAIQAMVNLCRT
ncbi:type II 3-dehydroquinate dehydratase [Sediminicoccus sp. KRV36]|uniref:type II 3-dehydroquinate dehydratase n=1 Tax=Sediminicoccus sp. KRV36 TaxID=3133721 RepID=UPI00200DDD03|nr:type II 3-dehydroquinate dehydratase [Sediminicoccus rosea]UPY38677.1 3-dehydroquinate dehydratase [Sediminicoccus rosea]